MRLDGDSEKQQVEVIPRNLTWKLPHVHMSS